MRGVRVCGCTEPYREAVCVSFAHTDGLGDAVAVIDSGDSDKGGIGQTLLPVFGKVCARGSPSSSTSSVG